MTKRKAQQHDTDMITAAGNAKTILNTFKLQFYKFSRGNTAAAEHITKNGRG
jgi:hypothetical protein